MTSCSISSPRASSRSRVRASRTIWSTRRASSVSRSSASPPEPHDLAGRIATRRCGPFFLPSRPAALRTAPVRTPLLTPSRTAPCTVLRTAVRSIAAAAPPRVPRPRRSPLRSFLAFWSVGRRSALLLSHPTHRWGALCSMRALVPPSCAINFDLGVSVMPEKVLPIW